jgi:M6 family metalloprotease-like protein
MSRMRAVLLSVLVLMVAGTGYTAPQLVALLSSRRMITDERWPSGVPVRICALRVEFLEDQVTGTTGDGRMGSGFDSALVLDPLPHDRAYFEDHLRFLKHYYETVSGGHLRFDTLAVYPENDTAVYRLDYPMWHYNHNDGNEDSLNRRLTELFVQSVRKADSAGVPFSAFDAVLVFHAGVGKDFNVGYDATPFDIPSAYISERDLQTYVPDFVLPAGVSRGLVLPEGENQREALDYGIELSLNGIVVKLFGNWLGLPDLFDTETGSSGIGRWGMMDQGSGNVSALVPAMPEAWSRVFMGWETPLDTVPSGLGDTVRVARFGHDSAPRIVRLPVTPREYYLIENRDSDADSIGYVELRDRDGRRLQVDHDGVFHVEPGFRVAVSASHYDFGIPGSGLLIWHIDEDVIDAGLDNNSINTNPDHRGVDLVEADGPQDIGRQYGFASPGSGAELGIAEDAWYRGNKAHLEANGNALSVRFTDHTFPSARMYDGAFTRLELTDFSSVDTVMSFAARVEGVQPGFPVFLPSPSEWAVADLNGDSLREIYFLRNDSLFERDSLVAVVPSGVHFAEVSAAADLNGDGSDELIFEGARLCICELVNEAVSLRYDSVISTSSVHVYPARNEDGTGALLKVWQCGDTAKIRWLDFSFQPLAQCSLITDGPCEVLNIESLPAQHFVVVVPGQARCVSAPGTSGQWDWTLTDSHIEGSGTVVAEPAFRSVYLSGVGYVEAATDSLLCPEPLCLAPSEDWDGDGIPDGGGRFGRQDAPRENFPRLPEKGTSFLDLDADGTPDLLSYPQGTSAGAVAVFTRIEAVSHNGTAFSSFPLASSVSRRRNPVLWGNDLTLNFVSVTHANGLYGYSVNRLVDVSSTQRFVYREPVNLINVGPLRPQVYAREQWAYCWPNPSSDRSFIRLILEYPARANVHIFDLAGRQVAALAGQSNLPGPFEIPWNLSGVESGVYLARVKAEGGGTTRETQIKIAVVK